MAALVASALAGLMVTKDNSELGGTVLDHVDIAERLAGECCSKALIWAMHCQRLDGGACFAEPALTHGVLPSSPPDRYMPSQSPPGTVEAVLMRTCGAHASRRPDDHRARDSGWSPSTCKRPSEHRRPFIESHPRPGAHMANVNRGKV